jgi:SAM-dependent methyltransferase
MLGESLQYELSRLADAAWAAAAFVAHQRGGLTPELGDAVAEVLLVSGLPATVRDEAFASALASQLAQAAAFASGHTAGWAGLDDEVLLAQGHGSGQVADWIVDQVIPALGVEAQLRRPGAAFLDVGVGTGQLAARIAARCPDLRVVGIDVLERALALARGCVHAAGHGDRVLLRRVDVSALDEEASFDLVWFPLVFIPPDAVQAGLAAVLRALRPGGWIIVTTIAGQAELPITRALARLSALLNGGSASTAQELMPALRRIGYTSVRSLPATPLTGVLTGGCRP